jgi:signal transduction histidine kinase/CheY-like chemotaxis protein/putative methionine-R-sulfoxide reductase with GAF domain
VSPPTAGAALVQAVTRVTACMRPADLQGSLVAPLVCAVFDEDPERPEGGPFLGLVTERDISFFPTRIFADLAPRSRPAPVRADAALEDVLARMDASGVDVLPVLDDSGGFAGAVSRTSILAAWLRQRGLRVSRRPAPNGARVLRALEEQVEQLRRLNAGSQRLLGLLARGGDLTEVLKEGIEALVLVLGARYGAVAVLDEAGHITQFPYAGVSPEEAVRIGRLPEGHGLLGVSIRTAESLIVEDISRDPRAAGFPPHHPRMKTLLAVPILHQGRVYGRVYLSDKTTGEPFSGEDEALASGFAKTISLVLSNADEIAERRRSEEGLRARTEQLEAIAGAAAAFLERGDWKEASAHILKNALRQTASEYGFAGLIVEGPALHILAHEGIVWDTRINREFYEAALRDYRERGYLEFTNLDNLFGSVVTSGKPVLSNDPAGDPRAGGLPPGHPALRSFLGVPMLKGNEAVGMIGVANRDGGYAPADQAKLEVLAGMAAVLYDSYRRQQRESVLEETLRQSQKMEAIGRLAGGVAHDFNNLLTVIIGHCDLLRVRARDEDAVLREIQEIRRAGERASSLTRQLLAFSRRQVLEPKVLALGGVVPGMLPMLRRLIRQDVELVTLQDPELAHVKTDPGQIEQVIMNLAVNARDAMPRGGRLTVETRNVDLDEAFARRHPPTRPGRYVMLAVSDTGCGMDERTRSRIFEPFFTTKEPGKGTGLGLATVYGIVKQSGGYIWVESEPGRGTSFRIYLPPVEGAVATAETAAAPPVPSLGTETVLLVEDEDVVRSLARQMLEMHGYRVLEAGRGPEALRICERHDGDIHLLLTDVVMPDMNGRALAERMKSLRPGIKVLYMSGYTADAIAHHGVLDVDVAFVQKPFSKDSLARKVREALDAPRQS